MRGPKIGPVLGSMAVAAIAAVTFSIPALHHHGTPEPTSVPVASDAESPFCPTAEEMQEHWNTYGEELKADSECADIEPAESSSRRSDSRAQGHHHAHEGTVGKPIPIHTYREAQRVLDPEDDPLTFIGRDPAGNFYALNVVMAPGQAAPPAWVRTQQQLARWMNKNGTGR